MKKIFLISICFLMLCATSRAAITTLASSDSISEVVVKRFKPKSAIIIIKNTYDANSDLRKKALHDLLSAAKSGNSEAMHYMGMISYTGIVGKQNLELARKWFERADVAGYLKSAYNLGTMYRLGTGVTQDFTKAYSYITRAGMNGDAQAVYMRGYLLYKGLGCNQSYEESIKCFVEASKKNHGYAMYMLGLCYRNGYGIGRDNAEANYWLKKASDKGIKYATEELSLDSPENVTQPTKIRGASIKQTDLPGSFRAVKHHVSALQPVQGDYTGSLVTYDWSGQHVIKEAPLQVTIEQNGNQIIARWKEDTLSIVEARGILTDTALVFTEATYSKLDHYHHAVPQTLNFVKAYLKTVQKSDTIILAGNLQFYSLDSKEPEKPMYMSLQTKQKAAAMFVADSKKEPMAYPNPFSGQLIVSFYLENEASCSISLSTMNGITVYQEPFGKLPAGAKRYQLQLDLPPANYLVKLVYGNKVYNTVVIKERNRL